MESIGRLSDIEIALDSVRRAFYETTSSIRRVLDDSVSLYFDYLALVGPWVNSEDDEKYGIEVLMVAFRRIMASLVMLESGLPQESHMVLRNALELVLVAIDVLYNEESLKQWRSPGPVGDRRPRKWYFKKAEVCDRIERNKNGCYPELERKAAKAIAAEWRFISNESVHVYSYDQIKPLLAGEGGFKLLGNPTPAEYATAFDVYRRLIFNVVTVLLGIHKYRQRLEKEAISSLGARAFINKYFELHSEI